MSKPLFISSALLVISMVWGLYDEAYGIRPWKGYQARFVKLYSRYLKTAAGGEADFERQIKASSDYKRLDAAMSDAEKAAMPEASGTITYDTDILLALPEAMEAARPASTPLKQGVRETIELLSSAAAGVAT